MPRVFERLRGFYTPVTDIKRRVFSELCKLVAHSDITPQSIEAIPYTIIGGTEPHYRCCVFRERAIIRERVRLACGLDLRECSEQEALLPDIALILSGKRTIKEPLVNVIKNGCEKCPEDSVVVTDLCKKCMAHPCVLACPVNAISIGPDRAMIDQRKCIKCLRCTQVCPYEAITRRGRPCAQACGVDAISSDEQGYAAIDHDKCVSCGLCIVSCPFGAIVDKSEILQVFTKLTNKNSPSKSEIHAIVAPSFVSQFGAKVTPHAIFKGLQALGFASVTEVAFGADADVLIEAEKLAVLMKKVDDAPKRESMPSENGHVFLGTSCCPSWVMAAKKHYPELAKYISDSYTPMVETAKLVKERNPGATVAFIGPCIAKKHESLQKPMSDHVDHVITFEELAAMFVASGIDLLDVQKGMTAQEVKISDGSKFGRGYPVAGGVCAAIATYAKQCHGIEGFEIARADTLRECREMLANIKKGKIAPRLVEGMACPDGCIGGPGTLAPLKVARRAVDAFSREAEKEAPKCDHEDG